MKWNYVYNLSKIPPIYLKGKFWGFSKLSCGVELEFFKGLVVF